MDGPLYRRSMKLEEKIVCNNFCESKTKLITPFSHVFLAELDAVGELAERLSVTQKETVSELHSTQSLYNFKIEVTAQMLDKTAHNLSENERLRHSLMASGTNQEKRDPGTVRELALKKIRFMGFLFI